MKKILFLFPIILVIIINILVSYIDFKIDLTEDKKHSVSTVANEILNELDDILFIKVYLDGDFPAEFKHLQAELLNLLTSFKSIAPQYISFEFINPNINNNKQERDNLFRKLVKDGLTPTDIDSYDAKTSSRSSQIIFPGALIYYKNKSQAVNFLQNSITKRPGENINASIENLEYEFISAIYHLTQTKLKRIAFLEGNGQLIPEEVYDLVESVMQDNNRLSYHYNVDRFNIKNFEIDSITKQADISKQIKSLGVYTALIIAKPTIPFNMLEKFIIDQYIMNGGKILWLIDGAKASMDSLKQGNRSFIATKNNLNLDDQLFKYGIRINSNLIEDLRSTQIPIVTGYSNNMPQQSYFSWPYYPLLFSENNHSISKNLDAIKCNFISSIDTIKNSIKKRILLTSSKQSRINPLPAKVTLGILENPPPIDLFNTSFPVAVLLEGRFESVFKNRIIPKDKSINFKEKSKETQMIIVSDGDIARNNILKTDGKHNAQPLGYDKFINYTYPGNKKFLMNSIHYLCDEIGLIELKSKEIKLRLLDTKKIEQYTMLLQLINIILPLFLLFVFTRLFVYIKNKKYA